MHPNITFTQLRCFVAAAETGGFTAAAQRIHLTQSAVSQAIAGLEDALGAKLLIRTRVGVKLTDLGEAAFAEAQALLAGAQRLAAVTKASDKLSGTTLRIGLVWRLTSLYGCAMGTTSCTPGAACNDSISWRRPPAPTAAMMVLVAPRVTCGWNPASRTRSITCWICSPVALSDMFTIIGSSIRFQKHKSRDSSRGFGILNLNG